METQISPPTLKLFSRRSYSTKGESKEKNAHMFSVLNIFCEGTDIYSDTINLSIFFWHMVWWMAMSIILCVINESC